MTNYSCEENGHVWELTETYHHDTITLANIYQCFECDLEHVEYEKIEK